MPEQKNLNKDMQTHLKNLKTRKSFSYSNLNEDELRSIENEQKLDQYDDTQRLSKNEWGIEYKELLDEDLNPDYKPSE